MSSAQTSTIPMPSGETYSSIDRVAQIPLVNSTISTFLSAVNSNSYTRYGFCTAKDLSNSVYKYAEPYQPHFTPILQKADVYANKSIDVAQQKFPKAFETKPEDVAAFVRVRTQSASEFVAARRDSVTKVIDERVKSPAISVAEGVDRGCTKLVDVFEVVVSKTSDGKTPATPVDAQYQYQRAFALSRNLKDNVYGYSTEQWKAIQEQNKLVQTAAATAQSITATAQQFSHQASSSLSHSIISFQDQVKQLSNRMIAELQNLQASSTALYASLQSTASNTVEKSAEQLQQQTAYLQKRLGEASTALASSAHDLQAILKKDAPFNEKLAEISAKVHEEIRPILDGMKNGFSSRTSSPTQEVLTVNGIH